MEMKCHLQSIINLEMNEKCNILLSVAKLYENELSSHLLVFDPRAEKKES